MPCKYNSPFVSVITVVYNDGKNIEGTILSVVSQSCYERVEYIVIDGGSNDDTLSIIDKYSSQIDVVISESDEGVFDAMNKALKLSRGRYVCFMNSGDHFCRATTIEEFVDVAERESEPKLAYFGWHHIRDVSSNEVTQAEPPENLSGLWKKMLFCHQSFFVDTDWHKRNPFNIDNFAADYEVVYKAYSEFGVSALNFPVSIYLSGGMSEQSIIKSTVYRFLFLWNYDSRKRFRILIYYPVLIVYLSVKSMRQALLSKIKKMKL